MGKTPDGKDTNVPSKTPEEIKKGLERCKNGAHCNSCLSVYHCQVEADALAYIEQLESERDAVVEVLKKLLIYENNNRFPRKISTTCSICGHVVEMEV